MPFWGDPPFSVVWFCSCSPLLFAVDLWATHHISKTNRDVTQLGERHQLSNPRSGVVLNIEHQMTMLKSGFQLMVQIEGFCFLSDILFGTC